MFSSKQFIVVWLLRRQYFWYLKGVGPENVIAEQITQLKKMHLILLISEVELYIKSFRKTELAVVSGEHVLCLNEKPTLREDFYWNILGESLDICSVFTVVSSAKRFLLSSIHTDDNLYLILQKDFPQMEERGRKKIPHTSFFSHCPS